VHSEGRAGANRRLADVGLFDHAPVKTFKPSPLVWIGMPAFNRQKTLEVAIRSILNQTFGNWELLLFLFRGPTPAISCGGFTGSACLDSCVQAVAGRMSVEPSALLCW
jgi:hypothetical protein